MSMKKNLLFILLTCASALQAVAQNISFTVSTNQGCAPLTVNITNTSTAPNTTTYEWYFGDGNTFSGKNPPAHTYIFPGFYTLMVEAYTAGGASLGMHEEFIMVDGPINGMLISADSACPGENISFQHMGMGADSILWSFGDGTTSNEFFTEHSYAAPGTYPVEQTLYTPCGNATYHDTVVVSTSLVPMVAFYKSVMSGCPGMEIRFFPFNSGGTYAWNFGDGATSTVETPSHSYSTQGNYYITLSYTNTCGNTGTYTDSISIDTTFSFNDLFLSSMPDPACPGDPVMFSAYSSSGPIADFLWDFGDGNTSTEEEPVHRYAAAGTYTVQLTASQCGIDTTADMPLSIDNNVPIDPFNYYYGIDNDEVCPGDTVVLYAFGGSSYIWDFGDGSPVETQMQNFNGADFIEHPYTSAGTYYAKVTIFNGCGDSFTDSMMVDITNSITPDAFVYWTNAGNSILTCDTVEFFPSGTGTYMLDYGDGTIDTTTSFVTYHNYVNPGTYTVTLNVVNGCGNTDSFTESITIGNCVTSIRKDAAGNMSIYPNPNRGEFTIELDRNGTGAEVEVYSTLGTLVHSERIDAGASTAAIQMKERTPGIYFVRVRSGENMILKKLIM